MSDISAQIQKQLQKLEPKQLRLFACDCAEHVLHHFEAFCPEDKRPRKAIKTARLFAKGQVSKDKLWEAMANAESAAYESSHKAWEIVANGGSISYGDEAAGSVAAMTKGCCVDDPFAAAEETAKMAAIEVATIVTVGLEAADTIWGGYLQEVDADTLRKFYEAELQERLWQLIHLQTYLSDQQS